MNKEDHFKKMRMIQKLLEEFLERENNVEENYELFKMMLSKEQIFQYREKTKTILFLIRSIAKNHNRQNSLIQKIEQIIKDNQTKIKQNLTNSEIFNIFKNEKLILLFLIEEKIINIDQTIFETINKTDKYIERKYREYFYPEIKQFLDSNKNKIEVQDELSIFIKKRRVGENDNYLCQIIREDLINDFIKYVEQTNHPLDSIIEPSIYETNSFLLANNPTLIEYAAFHGSVQIFKYLYHQKVNISERIWLYGIHGDNPEIIIFIEENKIEPENKNYQNIVKESIKCHHTDVSDYIIEQFIKKENEEEGNENDFDENVYCYSFHYHNYLYFPNDLKYKYTFFYACQYNYLEIVKELVKNKNFDINDTVISEMK